MCPQELKRDMPQQVTVLIPSAGRSHLIKYTLKGLQTQSFKDFEVLLVLRPNDVETVEVAEGFSKYLDVRILFQKRPGFMDAYNEGICASNGDVIMFLDDDAVPNSNCIREHLLTYERSNVSGVSGDVIPAYLVNGVLKPIKNSSDIVSFYKEPDMLRIIGDKLWNCPLDGQESYLAYLSKAGYSKKNVRLMHQKIANSLLCMGANTSILTSALKNFQIPTSFLKRGIANEQIIGWNLWRNGHTMVFNPRAKVYHIRHGQTLSRFLDVKNIFQATIENELLFYYLLPIEEKLSKMHRIVSLLYNSLVHIKKLRENWKHEMAVLRGILLGNMIGLKWLISREIGGSYVPTQDALFK